MSGIQFYKTILVWWTYQWFVALIAPLVQDWMQVFGRVIWHFHIISYLIELCVLWWLFYQWTHFVLLITKNLNLISIQPWTCLGESARLPPVQPGLDHLVLFISWGLTLGPLVFLPLHTKTNKYKFQINQARGATWKPAKVDWSFLPKINIVIDLFILSIVCSVLNLSSRSSGWIKNNLPGI